MRIPRPGDLARHRPPGQYLLRTGIPTCILVQERQCEHSNVIHFIHGNEEWSPMGLLIGTHIGLLSWWDSGRFGLFYFGLIVAPFAAVKEKMIAFSAAPEAATPSQGVRASLRTGLLAAGACSLVGASCGYPFSQALVGFSAGIGIGSPSAFRARRIPAPR